MLQHAAEDKMFARMLRGCHGMTGAPIRSFLTQLGDDEDLVTLAAQLVRSTGTTLRGTALHSGG